MTQPLIEFKNVSKKFGEQAILEGAKNAAAVIYRKPLTTLEMRCHRLSRGGNNMAAFH